VTDEDRSGTGSREAREAALTQAYLDAVDQLAASLWRHDPYGMGSSAGSPEDEYEDFARRLLVRLKEVHQADQLARHIRTTFGDASDELVEECAGIIGRFHSRIIG
jgi:hypothetical protein